MQIWSSHHFFPAKDLLFSDPDLMKAVAGLIKQLNVNNVS